MAHFSFFLSDKTAYVCVKKEEITCNYQENFSLNSYSEKLIPFFNFIFKKEKIDRPRSIIAPCGPTSFTNVRIALSVAKGLGGAFPHAICFSPTHFQVLSFIALEFVPKPFLILIDSKRGDYFGQLWNVDKTEIPKIYTQEEIIPLQEKIKIISLPDSFIESSFPLMMNIAEKQIELFLKEGERALNKEFNPYYFFMPNYKKKDSL